MDIQSYMNSKLTLKTGGWTPAIRSMALDLMKSLIIRPAAAAICDPTQANNAFTTIQERLAKMKYETVADWKMDVESEIVNAQSTGSEDMKAICEELLRWFEKKYQKILQLSMFKFKDATEEVIQELEEAKKQYQS